MPRTFFRTATLDDKETEIEVEIAVNNWGEAATYDDPGCGPEVEIIKAWLLEEANLPNAPDILASLTDAERERIETEFLEDPPEPDWGED